MHTARFWGGGIIPYPSDTLPLYTPLDQTLVGASVETS